MPIIRNDDRDPIKRDMGERLRKLKKEDPEKLKEIMTSMSPEELEEIIYDPEIWARDSQWIDLSGPEDIVFLCAGRGHGKSWTLASTIRRCVDKHGITSMLLIAPTNRTLTRTLAPAIMDAYPPKHPNRPTLHQGFMKFGASGAEIVLLSSDSGEDSPRSGNYEVTFIEEFAFYGNNEGIITQAELATRIPPAKLIGATTPKAVPILIDWVRRAEDKDPTIKMITGATTDNDNLDEKFRRSVIAKYKGTHLEDTELLGKLILRSENALFQQQDVERNTVDDIPEMIQYSIGVDIALLSKRSGVGTKKGRDPDSTAIVVSGMDENGIIYTLDCFVGKYTPTQWGERIAHLYDFYTSTGRKTIITMEVNAGGRELLQGNFDKLGRSDVGRHVTYTFATDSKMQRMLPNALIHEQGRIKFKSDAKDLDVLIRELITYDGSGKKSPNAYDAASYSWSALAPNKKTFVKDLEFLF